jgi:hypothetical protein
MKGKNESFVISLYIDKAFNCDFEMSCSSTVKELKSRIFGITNMISLNYHLEYKDRNYTDFDTFSLREIFLTKANAIDINLKTIPMYIKGI